MKLLLKQGEYAVWREDCSGGSPSINLMQGSQTVGTFILDDPEASLQRAKDEIKFRAELYDVKTTPGRARQMLIEDGDYSDE